MRATHVSTLAQPAASVAAALMIKILQDKAYDAHGVLKNITRKELEHTVMKIIEANSRVFDLDEVVAGDIYLFALQVARSAVLELIEKKLREKTDIRDYFEDEEEYEKYIRRNVESFADELDYVLADVEKLLS